MPNYIRWRETGAAYFFTVVTFDRRPFLTPDTARTCISFPRSPWECRLGYERYGPCAFLRRAWEPGESNNLTPSRTRRYIAAHK